MKNFVKLTFLCLILISSSLFAKENLSLSLNFDNEPRQYSDVILRADISIAKGVHIYSSEEQEVGLPTKLELSLPTGFKVKGIKWSTPAKFDYMGMPYMGYENKATAYFDIYVPRYTQGLQEISVSFSALACTDETCEPIDISLSKAFNVRELPSPTARGYIAGLALFGTMAFLGGMILNLMPCVFPIIGIKVLSFIKSAQEGKSKAIVSALSYSLGIVLSFLTLAGILLILKAMGMHYGWGFQLQEPIFVALMIMLFFAMALSFSGLFEIGTSLGNLGNASGKSSNTYLNAFLSGVLAVLVASPCTAPYMGTAIGAVLLDDYDLFRVLVIFTCLGLGMAFPYVALTLTPALQKRLPKAGEWLNTFKQFLAFLLYATCIWLFWVFSQQSNSDSSALLLFALLVMSLGLFIYGKYQAPHFSKLCRYLAISSAIIASIGAIYIVKIASIDKISQSETSADSALEALAQVEELRAQGEIVFVDYTAAWCATCQANKRLVLDTDACKELFAKHSIKLVRIDWTKRNPVIGEQLEKFGAIGVPLYLLYGKYAQEPIVLPNILTYSILEEKIAELTKK